MSPPLIHLSAQDMKTLLTGHRVTAPDDVVLECDATDDEVSHLEIITRAATSFLHGDDWDAEARGKLAQVLGEVPERGLPGVVLMHLARPGADEQQCGVCGQPIQRMPKPNSEDFIFVHLDSGTAFAPNPPGRDA